MILGEGHIFKPKASTSTVSNKKILHGEHSKSTEGKDFISTKDNDNIAFFTHT